MDPADLLAPRVLLVTGKGGVGKSSVAAAIAQAAVDSGRRTCLVEVEGRQTFSALFSTGAWDFTEREYRPGLWGLSIDPEASLSEYLHQFYGARRLSRLIMSSTAVEFATSAAPGIKDVLSVGKVKEMERRRDSDGRFHYDLIVVDAPPTGRITSFLRAPEATTQLVNVGPIRSQAQQLIDMLLDARRTNVVLVTLLEEMPVTETLEGIDALTELGVTVGPVIANRVRDDRLGQSGALLDAGFDAGALRSALAGAQITVDEAAADAVVAAGRGDLARRALEDELRQQLRDAAPVPVIELPELSTATFGPDEVAHLAAILSDVVDA